MSLNYNLNPINGWLHSTHGECNVVSSDVELACCLRDASCSKSYVKKLRKDKHFPAVIYGNNKDAVAIEASARDLLKISKKSGDRLISKVLTLVISSDDPHNATQKDRVIIKDIAHDSVTGNVKHVDFQRIDEKSYIKTKINVRFTGQQNSPGIKRGGVFIVLNRKIAVKANPANIAHVMMLDASHLNIGHSITIKDLNLPDDVVPISNKKTILAKVIGRGGSTASDAEEKS